MLSAAGDEPRGVDRLGTSRNQRARRLPRAIRRRRARMRDARLRRCRVACVARCYGLSNPVSVWGTARS